MKSVSQMLEDLGDVFRKGEIINEWEYGFVENMLDLYEKRQHQTVSFSSERVNKIIQLHMKHCS